jgi:hypothetical protein
VQLGVVEAREDLALKRLGALLSLGERSKLDNRHEPRAAQGLEDLASDRAGRCAGLRASLRRRLCLASSGDRRVARRSLNKPGRSDDGLACKDQWPVVSCIIR